MPKAVDSATVTLKMHPGWRASVLYPQSQKHDAGNCERAETITWNFMVSPLSKNDASKHSNLLFMKKGEHTERSMCAFSSLFWEALSTPGGCPDVCQCTTSLADRWKRCDIAFNPRRPSLEPENSVLLDFYQLIPHLEDALRELGLTAIAATDFMQYWMPRFVEIHEEGQGNSKIAFRFVAQRDLNEAAELIVEPKPDVITRVFLLFRGVHESSGRWSDWDRQKIRSQDWVGIAGVSASRHDSKLFRVVEWGGSKLPVHI